MPSPISEEEKRELKKSFDLFDDSKTGHVPASLIGLIIRGSGENPTEVRINDIVKKANEKDGTISFEEFLAIMLDIRANDKRLTSADVEAAFRVFDPDRKGVVHQDELRHVLTTLGEKLSSEEVDEMLSLVEANPDGTIDYSELSKKLIP